MKKLPFVIIITATVSSLVGVVMMQEYHKLFTAIERNEIGQVGEIINRDININHPLGEQTALIKAVECFEYFGGDRTIIDLLIEKGAGLNATGRDRRTPLIKLAAHQRRLKNKKLYSDLVHYLIKKGADITKTIQDGSTALHIAAYHGNTEVIEALFEEGADPFVRSNNGEMALNCAKRNRCNRDSDETKELLYQRMDEIERLQQEIDEIDQQACIIL